MAGIGHVGMTTDSPRGVSEGAEAKRGEGAPETMYSSAGQRIFGKSPKGVVLRNL